MPIAARWAEPHVCYNTKYGARRACSASWTRRRGIHGVGTAAHQTSSIWPTLVEQDGTWEVEGNMDEPRWYPPQLRINKTSSVDTWPVQAAHADPHAVVVIMHEIMPRVRSQMAITTLSCHDGDTDERSIGLDINLWGSHACWSAVTNMRHYSCGPTSLTALISIS